MKILVILVAGAQAFTCANQGLTSGLRNLVENNWWESAVETFNFIANNREQFVNTVKSVNQVDHF